MNHLCEFVQTMNTADWNLMDFDLSSRKVLVKSHKMKFEFLHIPGKIPFSQSIQQTIQKCYRMPQMLIQDLFRVVTNSFCLLW